MIGKNKLKPISNQYTPPFVFRGSLLESMVSNSAESLEEYKKSGGVKVLEKFLVSPASKKIVGDLEKAKVRGRAGGGYPVAHKWWLVQNNHSPEKFFICNVNSGSPGGFKEKYLINLNPYRIVEAVAFGALAVGASKAFIALPYFLAAEYDLLKKTVKEFEDANLLGTNILNTNTTIKIIVFQTPNEYILGEETALMEVMEGRIGRPRGKPPIPADKGLFGKPTCVNNLETVLQSHFVFVRGLSKFKREGIANAAGTIITCLSGNISRPGIYEIPLGFSLKDLIYDLGEGAKNNSEIHGVLPGGISSSILRKNELEIGYDYDSLSDAGSSIGNGSVIVIGENHDIVGIGKMLSKYYHDVSCGKCVPCKQGTERTFIMIENLNKLDEKSIDRINKSLPESKRTRSLNVIQPMGGISYTDTVDSKNKIPHLCEFYKFRGDCHHSFEAATSIQTLYNKFISDFENRIV